MNRRPESAGEAVPNLAPMVDVIMVLLVFFLLGTSLDLVKHGVLQTELDPASGPGGGARVEIQPQIRIALADVRGGEAAVVFLNEEPVGENAFGQLRGLMDDRRRAGADPGSAVVIGAEQNVRWEFVVQAMDAAVQARFANIQFAVSFRQGSISGSP